MMVWFTGRQSRSSVSMDSILQDPRLQGALNDRIDARLADRLAHHEAIREKLEAKIEALEAALQERIAQLEELRIVGAVSECVDNENTALRDFVSRLIEACRRPESGRSAA